MFLKTQFPHLWFTIQGTMNQLSLLKARLAFAPEDAGLNLALEAKRTDDQLNDELATLQPFAGHFTHSFALRAPNAVRLRALAQRVEALDKFESRFDALTAARHTAWDLSTAWAELEPQPEDISYMEILLERLELALLKAQNKGLQDFGEVILAVKNELSNYLMRFQTQDDLTSEFYTLKSEPNLDSSLS